MFLFLQLVLFVVTSVIELNRFALTKKSPIIESFTARLGDAIKVESDNIEDSLSFLKIISGLPKKYQGSIFVNEYNLKYNRAQFRESCQIILQSNSFYKDMKIGKQLSLVSKSRCGFDLSKAAMKTFGLTDYHDSNFGSLEKPIQRRFELAKIISIPCKIWVFEEITENQSTETTNLLTEIIAERLKQGGLVFFTDKKSLFTKIPIKTIKI